MHNRDSAVAARSTLLRSLPALISGALQPSAAQGTHEVRREMSLRSDCELRQSCGTWAAERLALVGMFGREPSGSSAASSTNHL